MQQEYGVKLELILSKMGGFGLLCTAAVVVAFSVTFEWDVRQVVDVVPSASVASSVILT
jgi:hypothetical protein